MKRDARLDVLLELHGTEYTEENGCWYKIEAWKVEPTAERPHGIRYNLTLHDNTNNRIFGYDNAHAVKTNKKHDCYKGRIIQYDHVHEINKETSKPYAFQSAQQLLEDFFNGVSEILTTWR